jgi:periplasmic protein CpxP/Spy
MHRTSGNPSRGAGAGDNAKERDEMMRISDRVVRAAAGAVSILVLLSVSAGLVAGVSITAEARSLPAGELTAQAAPAPQTPGQPTQPEGPVARVEVRISELHAKFRITPAQESQFKSYADVMRSNAQAMQELFQQRAQNTDNSAVNMLRWYARLTAAHADALSKLIPVFETLYQGMSDEQKKAADAVFQQLRQRRAPHRAG